MNEKILFAIGGIVGFLLGFIIIPLFSGCRSTVSATVEPIVSSQASVAKLQTVNDGLRDILQIYDEQIAVQSGRAIGGIDDALSALDRYDEFVQNCIQRIRELEQTTRDGEAEIK